VVAWGSLSKFKPRAAYDRTVENSIYVHHGALGRGYGRLMLQDQLRRAQEIGHRVILAVISADQLPSVKLHQQSGFTLMGQMNKVGYKFERWLDVQIWQRQLW
jgi:phosphinothricin acetyltransferase